MKTTELRIGNWVRMEYYPDKHYEYQIDSVNGHGVTINVLSADRYDIDEIFPIPLTEEWLTKFGFQKEESGNFIKDDLIYYYKNKKDFYLIADDPYCGVGRDEGVQEIKYVHQLQNLYFALTGKELEWK